METLDPGASPPTQLRDGTFVTSHAAVCHISFTLAKHLMSVVSKKGRKNQASMQIWTETNSHSKLWIHLLSVRTSNRCPRDNLLHGGGWILPRYGLRDGVWENVSELVVSNATQAQPHTGQLPLQVRTVGMKVFITGKRERSPQPTQSQVGSIWSNVTARGEGHLVGL